MSENLPDSAAQSAPKLFDDQLLRKALGTLVNDIDINRALQEHKPHKVYRLLQKKRKTVNLSDRDTIEKVLNNRRLFLEPISKHPTMYTLNGIGTSLYGQSEKDDNQGTYIATLFAVFVFAPLYPLAQYLVAPAEKGGWYFLGKAPFSAKHTLWRRTTELVSLFLVLFIVSAIFHRGSHSDVYLINALDIPVEVSFDHKNPQLVGANQVSLARAIPTGTHEITAKTQFGSFIEEISVDVPKHTDVVAYNVLGAASLYAQAITYYAKGSAPKDPAGYAEEPYEIYTGQRFITRDNVDYKFREPPEEIKMSSNKVKKWYFLQAPGGWQQSILYLADQGNTERAGILAKEVAEVQPTEDKAIRFGMAYHLSLYGEDATIEWLNNLTEKSPESIPAHRTLQYLHNRIGDVAKCRERYRKLYEESPDSAVFGYLFARAEPLSNSLALCKDLVTRFPDNPHIRRGYAWNLFQARQFDQALPHFEKLAAIDPQQHDALLSGHARTLIALNRGAEAVQLIANRFETGDVDHELLTDLLILYGQLARLYPASVETQPEQYLETFFGLDGKAEETMVWYYSFTDPSRLDNHLLGSLTNEHLRTAAMIMRDTPIDTSQSLQLIGELPDEQLPRIGDSTLLFLASEAVQVGNTDLANRLLTQMKRVEKPLLLKTNVLSPNQLVDLDEFDLELQSILKYFQAKRLRKADEPVDELYKLAREDDLLQRIVARVPPSKQSIATSKIN